MLKASLLVSLLISSTAILPAAIVDVKKGSDKWLEGIYNSIWANNSEAIKRGEVNTSDDRWLGGNTNVFTWTTILIRLNGTALQMLGGIVEQMAAMEPGQFPHKTPWLHSTVFIFKSERYPNLDSLPKNDDVLRMYGPAVEEAIAASGVSGFRLSFKGIYANKDTTLTKGYSDGNIQRLRDSIRTSLNKHEIPNDYTSGLNHSSLGRFCSPLKNPAALYDFINRNAETDLGYTDVIEVEMVRHIWAKNDHGAMNLWEERIAVFPLEERIAVFPLLVG